MSQLTKLTKPFPAAFVSKKGDRGDAYVAHPVVNQALLATCGPFSQRVVEIIRDAGMDNIITGVVLALDVTIDGVEVHVEEAGDVENPTSKPSDGARLKDAISDAFKRCCMRPGLGLSLWAGEAHYFLHRSLLDREDHADGEAEEATDGA